MFQEGGKVSESSTGANMPSLTLMALWPWEATSPSTSLIGPLPYPVPCWFARRGQPVEVDRPRAGSFGVGVLWGAQDTVGDWECRLGLVLEGQVQFVCSG